MTETVTRVLRSFRPVRILTTIVAAWSRLRKSRRNRLSESELRYLSRHVRRDIGLDP